MEILAATLVEPGYGDTVHRNLVVSNCIQEGVIGVIKDGKYNGKFIHILTVDSSTMFKRLQTIPENMTFVAVKTTNGYTAGDEYCVKWNGDTGTQYVLCDKTMIRVCLEASQENKPLSKNYLKHVTTSTGKTLNREDTMRALTSWLTSLNKIYAERFHVDQLVWCEEGTRSDRPTLRTFFYWDITSRRKKTCPNATFAIDKMYEYTQRDFYSDMSSNTVLAPETPDIPEVIAT